MLDQPTTIPTIPPETTDETLNSSIAPEEGWNWRSQWYPVMFLADLPPAQPYAFSIYGEAFVLFRDEQGQLVCLEDRCPHRAAKLSDGQVLNGRLECLYHGWQFGATGACLHSPHLLESATMPARACVPPFAVAEHQGIVWVWPDRPDTALVDRLPTVPDLEKPGVFVVDTATDLPFDHPFLVENLLDPAHVYISHDRTELGIRREDAQPLAMEILQTSPQGIQARFRRANQPNAPWTSLNFVAPCLVHYSFSKPDFGVIGGLALHALPLAYGKSRILVRRYGNIFNHRFTLKPRWLEHLRQNKILEEDLRFIVEQQRYLERSQQPLKSVYFPLKTCDMLVIAHRQWLDQFGGNLPWYIGYETAKAPPISSSGHVTELFSRWARHTQQCQSCRLAYQRLQWLYRGAFAGAIGLLALAIVTDGLPQLGLTIGFVLATVAAGAAHQLSTHFE